MLSDFEHVFTRFRVPSSQPAEEEVLGDLTGLGSGLGQGLGAVLASSAGSRTVTDGPCPFLVL